MSEQVERAAGGLVVRQGRQGREVLLIDDAYGQVAFPKGHLEPGETWEEAAVREILEETGVEARIVGDIGRIEYRIERNGDPVRKQVRLYLLQAEGDVSPVHQVEEVNAAYFLPWDEAKARHEERGYPNWAFAFAKAEAILDWLDGGFEEKFRQLSLAAPVVDLDQAFVAAHAALHKLVAACRAEVLQTLPQVPWFPAKDVSLPRPKPSAEAVQAAIESTLLRPEASEIDIQNLCVEAIRRKWPTVCVSPRHVALARRFLGEQPVRVCTVVGFPHGASTQGALRFEVADAVACGAVEIDMVGPVGALCEGDLASWYAAVRAVVDTAHQFAHPPVVKVILETSALAIDGVIKGALVAAAAGADFVKTSTGFHTAGARIADVAAMAMAVAGRAGVKASAGIRTPEAAVQLMRYGADRLGTSAAAKLLP
ncbi:hypothetical protein Heshes_18190 [Alicyclobacillus hesperidum]|uniref:Deoxyribose-phosphate aldolase n=1 Tax=Alicyclobacillus hesperidum TaxID=89784 RepID=A0A1H2UAT0_9BACL|nr:deoxyribose-phosphate aldolase [Alicyclobacillus hesperidum]GLV14135.1 hypothetical protein Heshes_18190 [Alicyclobacillus hesperidum]SDW52719.1 deoxyribose-phosphate aldolase [Alicyclobacillus hesperidum]